jgi:putative hydrolase of the HAD superfamily
VIRAVISDFGGVLTAPLVEAFLAYQRESGVSMEDLGRAMAAAAEERGEHPLYALERGEISEREFRGRLEAQFDGAFHLERFRDVYFDRLAPNARMIDFMAELRTRGLRMALLTNNVREWEPLWRAKLPQIDEIFDVVVDSAFVGMRKPERRIYELTLERLGGIAAAECLFLDDIDANCATAAELGMRVVRFETNEQAIAEVERALVD